VLDTKIDATKNAGTAAYPTGECGHEERPQHRQASRPTTTHRQACGGRDPRVCGEWGRGRERLLQHECHLHVFVSVARPGGLAGRAGAPAARLPAEGRGALMCRAGKLQLRGCSRSVLVAATS